MAANPELDPVKKTYNQWINCARLTPKSKFFKDAQTMLDEYDALWKSPKEFVTVPHTTGSQPDYGVLWVLGYSVKVEGGIKAPPIRQYRLETIFTREVPPLVSQGFHAGWGRPKSNQRINEMIHQLTKFYNENRRYPNKNKIPLERWEEDLKFLDTIKSRL